MALHQLDEDDRLPRAVVADPRAVAARWPDDRTRLLAEVTRRVTEEPWTLSPALQERARAAGLGDDELLHVVALSAFFGHLNRVADAVDVPLDYPVEREPPRAEPATPRLLPAPAVVTTPARLGLAQRPATSSAWESWRAYVLDREVGVLDRPRRARIAAHVAALLGAGDPSGGEVSELDAELLSLAERVTLAPWQLGDEAYAPLRRLGLDDAALFDVVVVASTAGVGARIDVALRALG